MTKKDDVKIVSYQLVRDYWDNRQVIEKGGVVDFPEGKQPRGSIELTKTQAKTLRGQVVDAALDPVQVELDLLRSELAKVKASMKGGEPLPAKAMIPEPKAEEPVKENTLAPVEKKIAPKG